MDTGKGSKTKKPHKPRAGAEANLLGDPTVSDIHIVPQRTKQVKIVTVVTPSASTAVSSTMESQSPGETANVISMTSMPVMNHEERAARLARIGRLPPKDARAAWGAIVYFEEKLYAVADRVDLRWNNFKTRLKRSYGMLLAGSRTALAVLYGPLVEALAARAQISSER